MSHHTIYWLAFTLACLLLASCITLPDRVTHYTGCPPAAIPARPPAPPELQWRESEDGEDVMVTKTEFRALQMHRARVAQSLELAYTFIAQCKPGAIK